MDNTQERDPFDLPEEDDTADDDVYSGDLEYLAERELRYQP